MEVPFILVMLLAAQKNPMADMAEIQAAECGPDQFFDDGLCKNCAPCNLLNRLPPRGYECAKTDEQCGPCKPGFQVIELTVNRYTSKCEPILETVAGSDPAEDRWSVIAIVLVSVIVVVGLVAFLLAVYHSLKRIRSSRTSTQDEEAAKMLSEAPPPPYESQSATAPPFDAQATVYAEECTHRIVVSQCEDELVSEAVPIRNLFDGDDNPYGDPDRFIPAGDPDTFSNASDETLPDTWVATEDQVPRNTQPMAPLNSPSPEPRVRRLRRSQSDPVTGARRPGSPDAVRRAHSVPLRTSGSLSIPSSPSPNLIGTGSQDLVPLTGIYEGVHVRLSEVRWSLANTPSVTLPGSSVPYDDHAQSSCTTPGGRNLTDEGEEPGPPRSFSFEDVPTTAPLDNSSALAPWNLSSDSGFEDGRRRRPSNFDEICFELSLVLAAKRRRNE